LPDHSSLTRIRQRYGLEVFRCFFEKNVELCIEARLVWGKKLYFDSTKVEANASMNSLAPRFAVEAHLERLFDDEEVHETDEGTLQSPPSASLHPCPQPTTKSFGQRTLRRATGSPGKGAISSLPGC